MTTNRFSSRWTLCAITGFLSLAGSLAVAEVAAAPNPAAESALPENAHPSPVKRRDLMKMRATVRNYRGGLAFRQESARSPGVVSLPSGLQYRVIKDGHGASPKKRDTVEVFYRGTLLDGTDFVHVQPPGSPALLRLSEQIPGLQEGLSRMPVGSKWQFTVPPGLAFGSAGAPPTIGPEATLVYEVELLSIQPRKVKGLVR